MDGRAIVRSTRTEAYGHPFQGAIVEDASIVALVKLRRIIVGDVKAMLPGKDNELYAPFSRNTRMVRSLHHREMVRWRGGGFDGWAGSGLVSSRTPVLWKSLLTTIRLNPAASSRLGKIGLIYYHYAKMIIRIPHIDNDYQLGVVGNAGEFPRVSMVT